MCIKLLLAIFWGKNKAGEIKMESKIGHLLVAGESEELEYKTALPRNRELARLIAGMANSNGGDILVGVDDNGAVIGIQKDANISEGVMAAATSLNPPVNVSTQFYTINGRDVLHIKVPHSLSTHFDNYGKYFKRVGEKTEIISTIVTSDGTRVFTESGSTAYIKFFGYPD